MINKNNNEPINRRELLKLFGFGSALLLSSCVSKSQNTNAENSSTLPPKASDVPKTSSETDAPKSTESEFSPTDAPTDLPLSLEEEFLQIQQPLNIDPLSEDEWMSLPIVPEKLSQRMLRLFALGQEMGRDARLFSVVGDCQTIPSYFLGNFDDSLSSSRYTLGDEYAYLQETIDYYKGSYKGGVAAKGGQNVAAVFSPLWANPEFCKSDEGPLACELRLKKSVFTFISLEENWKGDLVGYVNNLEKVVLYTLSQGVIPILSTKANNLEGDHSINRAIVEIARRYELPLWNFWASVQDIPKQGLDADRFHLTFSLNLANNFDSRFYFQDSTQIDTGWGMRNITALMLLDFMRKNLVNEIGLGHQMIFQLERWIRHS
ncbi:MAG: hypothetical protein HON98_05535 [Chloroflexi bacterium]|jgi:hypothetical protein|nr:hypothetical protein [Chloroflexota bacterium]MBT3670144.1 hypothetical protein [Chloroflexota bacterium]MBT4004013.1 hypothetical protein [Chloroflexota bacterium]MBT4306182.1 hypothetical protein [Chloroflexota bacterium]MBT4534562.1 hypothetical protein [Chloroflexota bacterium]